MRVRILGSAAGGGFPQWNCHCETCEAARVGERARPRTQSSLAIRGDEGPWFLVNASPDARQQLEALPARELNGVRGPPVAGVLLTDAEIDHTAGLLLLRESQAPVRVFGAQGVEHALRSGFPVLEVLERYCGAEWQTLEPEQARPLEGSSLTVEPFETGGDAPRYLDGSDVELQASGFVFRDSASGGVVTYAPGLARLDDGVLEPARHSPTSCSSTEPSGATTSSPGSASRSAARTTWDTWRSRVPAERSRRSSGSSGRARCSSTSTTRTRSCSRTPPSGRRSEGAGVEVAYDGLEIEL